MNWNNKEEVLIVVKQNGLDLGYASNELQNDKDVVLEAVKQSCWALEYASEELQADKEIVLTAIENCGQALDEIKDIGIENWIVEEFKKVKKL